MDTTLINAEVGFTVLINKPIDWTSFDVVNRVRGVLSRSFGRKRTKVGHAGTLDPKATGLLILCIGRHTKKIQLFQNLDKTYTGSMILGASTPSYDSESEPDQFYPVEHIDSGLIERTRQKFVGEIDQIPPIFSALKKDGMVAYKAARSGKKITLSSRKVSIESFRLTNITAQRIDFMVKCSKGTYIRSLVHDFGKALGSGAYLTSLCRTGIGPYLLQNAWDLDDFVDFVISSIANK